MTHVCICLYIPNPFISIRRASFIGERYSERARERESERARERESQRQREGERQIESEHYTRVTEGYRNRERVRENRGSCRERERERYIDR